MTKQSKIFIALFVFALIGLSLYGYRVFHERSLVGTENENKTEDTDKQDAFQFSPEEEISNNDVVSDNSAIDSPLDADGESTTTEKNNLLDVSKNDCKNSCKDFTDPEDLKYCQQICNPAPTENKIKEKKGCDALKDLEKDYCLKDLAINQSDVKICEDIDDTNIMKVCKNRIAEDVIEKQVRQ